MEKVIQIAFNTDSLPVLVTSEWRVIKAVWKWNDLVWADHTPDLTKVAKING